MNGLNDKLVLITGAARGLGFAMAEAFAGKGARVVIADVLEKQAAQAAGRLRAQYGTEAWAYGLDVTDPGSIESLFRSISEQFGRLDVLVNNAGVQVRHSAKDFPKKDWDFLMDVDLNGVFFCCQQAVKLMGPGGAIVSISSSTATETIPGRAPYCIAKGAVQSLTAVLAAEWGAEGIRVNAVAPGWVMTDMVKDGIRTGIVSEPQLLSVIPMKRLGRPAEIAGAVVFLASEEAAYITGQTLYADGGWSVQGLPDMDYLK